MRPPRVSVVTPIYNAAATLAECIESVLTQTFGDWEYVLVDNGSTDATPEILRRYADLDSRLRIVRHSSVLPVIQNWNSAVREIDRGSEYCKIVHADDWLFPECLARMVDVGDRHPGAGIVGAYSLYGEEVRLDGLEVGRESYPGREIARRSLLGDLRVFGSPTALLLRSSLVREHDPFYAEDELHADRLACYALLRESDFAFVPQVLTFNRVHEGSLTSTLAHQVLSYRITDLSVLRRFGPDYLTPEEMHSAWEALLRTHYAMLAKRLLRRTPERFWSFQRKELARIGAPLDRKRLAMAWLSLVGERLANPGETLRGQLRTRLGHGQPSPQIGSFAG